MAQIHSSPSSSDLAAGGCRSVDTIWLMATIKRVAPILPVRDLSASLAHYQRLGFDTRQYEGGGYAFVTRAGIEIHLGLVSDVGAAGSKHSAYLWVDDADALAQAWMAAGAL